MKHFLAIQRRTLLVLAALCVLASAASAQPDAKRKAAHIDRLAETLDLTDAQRAIFIGAETERGTLWDVAAALAPTLSNAQKATLFARPERPARGERRGGKGRRGGNRGHHPDAEARAEHLEERHEAMKEALGLSAEQAAQLDALHAEHRAQREARQAERAERMRNRTPGELPTDLAAILNPEQQEVFKVHRALAMRMHHGRRHHRQDADR